MTFIKRKLSAKQTQGSGFNTAGNHSAFQVRPKATEFVIYFWILVSKKESQSLPTKQITLRAFADNRTLTQIFLFLYKSSKEISTFWIRTFLERRRVMFLSLSCYNHNSMTQRKWNIVNLCSYRSNLNLIQVAVVAAHYDACGLPFFRKMETPRLRMKLELCISLWKTFCFYSYVTSM